MSSVNPTMSVHFQNGRTTKGLKYCHCTLMISNLYNEHYKSKAWSCYIITSIDGEWYFIKKFSGRQICATAHIRWRRQSAIAFCVTLHYLKLLVLQGTLMRSWKTSNNLLLILLIYYQSCLSQPGTILNQLKLLCFLEWITIQSKIRRKYPTKAHYHLNKTSPGILCATDIPQNTLKTMYWLDLLVLCVFLLYPGFPKTVTHTKERKEKKGCSNISIG